MNREQIKQLLNTAVGSDDEIRESIRQRASSPWAGDITVAIGQFLYSQDMLLQIASTTNPLVKMIIHHEMKNIVHQFAVLTAGFVEMHPQEKQEDVTVEIQRGSELLYQNRTKRANSVSKAVLPDIKEHIKKHFGSSSSKDSGETDGQ